MKTGGRCACIVPDGVLFGSSNAHRAIRQEIVDGHKLDGVFKPYAGGTDYVWFYDMQADGLSLDDKREPVEANDIQDILEKWHARPKITLTGFETLSGLEQRKTKSFLVPVQEIRDNKYEEVEYDPPQVILDQLESLETEITQDLQDLRAMLTS